MPLQPTKKVNIRQKKYILKQCLKQLKKNTDSQDLIIISIIKTFSENISEKYLTNCFVDFKTSEIIHLTNSSASGIQSIIQYKKSLFISRTELDALDTPEIIEEICCSDGTIPKTKNLLKTIIDDQHKIDLIIHIITMFIRYLQEKSYKNKLQYQLFGEKLCRYQ